MDIRDLPEIEAILKEGGRPQFIVVRLSSFWSFVTKLEFSGAIDEQDYLKRPPDVAKAIAEKKLRSARDHYVKSGYFEKRKVKILAMDKAKTAVATSPTNGVPKLVPTR
jgi:hypothetical protein